ncbi:MAG: VIT1/CCC1 transporter family protein [Thermoflexales bacterium]|nr:VIT1/CCC1 transporter family protein [Thermoflexales bacterium]
MPATPHIEKHFTSSETVRDIVIGMSDGLTVPFALAAGLSGAASATTIVVTAGLAEIAAGSIAMGLGGYMAARGDAEHYAAEREREVRETKELAERERAEVSGIFQSYGLSEAQAAPIVSALAQNPDKYVDFMMRYELGLEAPDKSRELKSPLTIGLSYIAGGLIPLAPYMLIANMSTALVVSVVFTLIALFVFGAVKGRFTGAPPLRSGLQTLLIGGIAAGVAFGVAKLLG